MPITAYWPGLHDRFMKGPYKKIKPYKKINWERKLQLDTHYLFLDGAIYVMIFLVQVGIDFGFSCLGGKIVKPLHHVCGDKFSNILPHVLFSSLCDQLVFKWREILNYFCSSMNQDVPKSHKQVVAVSLHHYYCLIFTNDSVNFSQVSVDIDGLNTWKQCFTVNNVRLPTGYYFGASAATGDLSGLVISLLLQFEEVYMFRTYPLKSYLKVSCSSQMLDLTHLQSSSAAALNVSLSIMSHHLRMLIAYIYDTSLHSQKKSSEMLFKFASFVHYCR